jgi:hypothetical protein
MNKTTTLYIDPQTNKKAVGQDFIINISISNVADLYGWQSQLSWNKTILDIVNVTGGPFLESGGNSPFFSPKIYENGTLLLDCSLQGNVNGVNGSGVLATIWFHVAVNGECDLRLYGTILANSLDNPIAHNVKSGKFST